MNRKILNILIAILILLPFGVLVYFYGGFNKKTVNKNIISTQPCEQIPTVYFGIMKSNDHISLSEENNYLYTSLGVSNEYHLAFPQSYNYIN